MKEINRRFDVAGNTVKRSDQMRYLTGDECRDNNIIFGHNQNQEFERKNTRIWHSEIKNLREPDVPIISRTDRFGDSRCHIM